MTDPITTPSGPATEGQRAMRDDTKVQYRLPPGSEMDRWLTGRAERMHAAGNRNEQARTELGLLKMILDAELARIRLTLAEASCLADVLKATTVDPVIRGNLGLVYAEVYDAFRLARNLPLHHENPYGDKWHIDEDLLLDKLAELGPAADHALRDAIARWWELPDAHGTVDGFARVGLRVTDTDGQGARGETDR